MKLPQSITLSALAVLAVMLIPITQAIAQQRPNIVVIMGDDIGIWNIGAYHRGMMAGRTPNLDQIAAEGMLFTDYYAEASCTAGRANFITGELPIRTGMTTEEFETIVQEWIATAKHPVTKRPYTEMVYQPMREVLAYLRANGFKTFIVSGGGIEFMRPWVERVYGVPPEQVIGSSIKTQFEWRDGKPVLMRLPEVNFIDDKTGKPVGINEYIGRRPIAAFGNSDGDLEMLQWTTAGRGARLALLVHHTDAEREWAYDRTSAIGRLDQALDAAQARGWTVVSMQQDWKRIFPFAAK